MICSNCGKEIHEGASYCLECGASIDEPVVIKDIKTNVASKNIGDEGQNDEARIIEKSKLFDYSGYVSSLGKNPAMLIGLLAGILVYLSTFFSWIWISQWGEKTSRNLFELGGKNGDMAVDEKIIIVMAVLIILSSIDMIAFSACEHIGPLKMFEKQYLLRALPIVLTLIFFIIIVNNKDYSFLLESIKNQEASHVELGENYDFSGGMGAGPVMLILGQVLYGASVYMEYLRGKNNG